MPKPSDKPNLPAAARVFGSLQADAAALPGQPSALRRSGALLLALLVLAATPLYLAANAAGLIGDAPAAIAKSGNSGPGGGDDDDSSGPGSGGDDDDDSAVAEIAKTDDTSANGQSTRGTTADDDTNTNTQRGTDDTSRNGDSTRGTTNDNDTNTRTGTQTRTQGQTQTRTRTGS